MNEANREACSDSSLKVICSVLSPPQLVWVCCRKNACSSKDDAITRFKLRHVQHALDIVTAARSKIASNSWKSGYTKQILNCILLLLLPACIATAVG